MWWSYSDAKEQKAKLQRNLEARKRKGERWEALEAPGGRKLCTTFWGQAWCTHLEQHADFEYRLPRGRSYLRQGNVYNLQIDKGELHAKVAGSELYDTKISITPLSKAKWSAMVAESAGQVGSMIDLLAGKLGDDLMRVVTDADAGLFPKPKEIRFDCSCPDYADMCKHCAAVLYGVGVLLDRQPELLFTLRGVDATELLSQAGQEAVSGLAATGADELGGADLSAMFGIEIGDDAPAAAGPEPVATRRPAKKKTAKAAKKAAKKKPVTRKKAAAKKQAAKKKARG